MLLENKNITALILAGGKSSRMGVDKGLALFKNKPMVQYALNAVKDCCSAIQLISNQNGYEDFGFPVYKDLIENVGPIGGIYTGLTHSTTDINIILTCDSPLIDKELIQQLIEEYDSTSDILFCNYQEIKYPLTAIYSKRILPQIKKLIDQKEYKVRSLFDYVNCKKFELNKTQHHKLTNVNTLKELNQI